MKYSETEWKKHFRRFPKWILVLILILIFGRFVITAVFHWMFG